jgi:isopentenyl-diphosphate Delta-isomerase
VKAHLSDAAVLAHACSVQDAAARTESQPNVDSRRRDPKAKLRHIEACLQEDVEYRKSTGLERFELTNHALPEVSLEHLDLSVRLVGKLVDAPLMIAPMTGGTEKGHEINRVLARSAQRWNLPMSVGSQRVALEDATRVQFLAVRTEAPDIVLFANFGAAQLVRGWGVDEGRRAVHMVQADALFIHLNPIQEAIQGGDRDFRGLAAKLTALCRALSLDGIPVFAREICFGLNLEAVRMLLDCGVAGIDCAGAGGTSWAKVEALCATTERRRAMGLRFREWGIPTSRSILNVRAVSQTIPLIATGGLRSGIDLARALALGADVGAMARPFLLAATDREETLDRFIADTLDELRICMFGVGAESVAALRGCIERVESPIFTPDRS